MMIDWIMRVKLSVPPPAPEVTTNSTGFDGCQAAADVASATSETAAASAVPSHFMRVSSVLARPVEIGSRARFLILSGLARLKLPFNVLYAICSQTPEESP